MSKIYNIQNIPADILPEVGGKARGLKQLLDFNYDVPEAFIITDIQDNEDLQNVVDHYHKLNLNMVSVRSSATLEDAGDFSAAGQFSTFLNVEGDEPLKEAVRGCVASLNNAEAEQYAKNFLHSAENRMTVVVQEMVDPLAAGVIFTKDPQKPGYVLIEAVKGLGENLVSGKTAAQQYRVRQDRVEQMPENPILTAKQATTIGRQAYKLERLFGQPMDLEWAMDKQGKVWWLQARPITIEQSVNMNEFDCRNNAFNDVITTSNIGEVMPGAVTPLNLSTNMVALDWGVMETYLEIGCIDKPAKPLTYISPYYNHMFFNMSRMYQVNHAAFGTSKESLEVNICGRPLDEYPDIEMKVPTLKKIRNTIVFLKIVMGGEKAKNGMDRAIASIKFDLTKDMNSIYQQILDNFDALKWVQYYHYCTSYYSGGQTNFLVMGLQKKYPDSNELSSLIAGAMTEIEDFESANILRMMRELAALMIEDEPATAKYNVEQLQDYYLNRANDKVRAKYDEFMRVHGHRGIREMEIRSASWRDNPASFFSSMRSVLISSAAGSKNVTSDKHWTDYVAQMTEGLKDSKRKKIENLVVKARKGVFYREYTKGKVVYGFDMFKRAYAQLAKLMTEAQLLPDEDCIYFLTQEEVGKVLKGESSLIKKALARRRLLPQQMALKFPDTMLGTPQPLQPKSADPNATQFKGTPVSCGVATGKARVVYTEEDAIQLQNGEIMIAAGTDVGWTPYYNIIGGLVTEIGSSLSHGIVVAREYSLPAVVNVTNVMQEIHTGDEISIDGSTGIVTINKRA